MQHFGTLWQYVSFQGLGEPCSYGFTCCLPHAHLSDWSCKLPAAFLRKYSILLAPLTLWFLHCCFNFTLPAVQIAFQMLLIVSVTLTHTA
jgi:hypothetical protein